MGVREKLVELLTEFYGCDPMYYDVDALAIAQHLISNRVTVQENTAADVAPVRHGRWEMNSDRPDNIICTNCDAGFDVWKHEAKDFNYCPNCGAKMYGGED